MRNKLMGTVVLAAVAFVFSVAPGMVGGAAAGSHGGPSRSAGSAAGAKAPVPPTRDAGSPTAEAKGASGLSPEPERVEAAKGGKVNWATIGDIKGESTDKDHRDYIGVLGF
jgi:hypothetical protein